MSQYARKLTGDSAGRVSHAYISQLETGVLVAITLPKLLSLAAIYNTDVSALITMLPEPQRSQRFAELQQWTTDERAIPDPLLRVPKSQERTDAQLDELFAKRARGFTVPWEWKNSCEREVRAFLPFAILPPLVESSPDLLGEFWKLHPLSDLGESWTADRPGALALVPLAPWGRVVELFVSWATRETHAIAAAMGLLSWWTLDFATSGASCHFIADDLDVHYGFDMVPPGVVTAVRRWQLAHLLFRRGAPPSWPMPPEPIQAARQFIAYLLRPQPFLPEHAPAEPATAGAVYSHISKLVDLVPALRVPNRQINTQLLEAVASLLNRAVEKHRPRSRGKPRPR